MVRFYKRKLGAMKSPAQFGAIELPTGALFWRRRSEHIPVSDAKKLGRPSYLSWKPSPSGSFGSRVNTASPVL